MTQKNGIKTLVLAISSLALLQGQAHPLLEETRDLSHSRVAILTTERFNDFEVLIPLNFLRSRNASITVIGDITGEVTAHNSARTVQVEKKAAEVDVEDFDILIIPGGFAPERLRQNAEVVDFTRRFFESGKPVAAICHGPEVLVEAGILKGKRATCFSGISDQLVEAGAHYINEPLVIDDNLITSRMPSDIPDFCLHIAYILARSHAGGTH